MNENTSPLLNQIQQKFRLRSPNREMRVLIFEYALIAAVLGLNPFPRLFSWSLILLGCLNFKMMRDIGTRWGYPKGQDLLAIAGNLFGGIGALVMACLAWGLMIVSAIYLPISQFFALLVGYATFTWIAGQATNQFYATGKASEVQVETQMAHPVGIANQLAGGGGSLQRRKILLAMLAAGTLSTGFYQYAKRQEFMLAQAKLSALARESDAFVEQFLEQSLSSDTLTLQETQAIKTALKLVPPTAPYDRTLSKLLIRCARLGTEQYITGTIVPDYQGEIKTLPSFEPSMSRYTQVASLVGPEEATTSRKLEVPTDPDRVIMQPDRLRENLNQIEQIVRDVGGQVVTLKWLNPVYWGFILQSPDHSIIAFRGTQQTNEWIQNVWAQQFSHTNLSPFEFEGRVHRGFFTLYSPLAHQVFEAAQKLNPARPIYITGHSLGAAMATLAAMDLAIRLPELRDQLRLYTYASPRIGNVEFAEAHSRLVPNYYRVVNMADGIPAAPPTITGRAIFAHSGQLWAFVDYPGDLLLGHFVSVYRKAIDAEQETLKNIRT